MDVIVRPRILPVRDVAVASLLAVLERSGVLTSLHDEHVDFVLLGELFRKQRRTDAAPDDQHVGLHLTHHTASGSDGAVSIPRQARCAMRLS